MQQLKGEAKVCATFFNVEQRTEMIRYADGRWGIRDRGSIHSVWEVDHFTQCMRAFIKLTGTPDYIGFRGPVTAGLKTSPAN